MNNIIGKFKQALEQNFLLRNIVLAISVITLLLIIVYFALSLFTRHGEKYKIPDFSSMTLEDANRLASKHNFRLEIIDSVFVAGKPKGVIVEQYPKAGNAVKSKRRIFLTTTTYSHKMVPIPYVTGFSLRQAKNKITGAGLEINKLTYKQDIATNNVLEQRYKGKVIRDSKEIGEIGSGIELIVGYNPVDEEPIIPDLIGLTYEQAKSKLWESGFNVGTVEQDNNITSDNITTAKVYEQSIGKNRSAMYGRTVSFSLTTDAKKVSQGEDKSNKEAQKYMEEKAVLDSLGEEEE